MLEGLDLPLRFIFILLLATFRVSSEERLVFAAVMSAGAYVLGTYLVSILLLVYLAVSFLCVFAVAFVSLDDLLHSTLLATLLGVVLRGPFVSSVLSLDATRAVVIFSYVLFMAVLHLSRSNETSEQKARDSVNHFGKTT